MYLAILRRKKSQNCEIIQLHIHFLLTIYIKIVLIKNVLFHNSEQYLEIELISCNSEKKSPNYEMMIISYNCERSEL